MNWYIVDKDYVEYLRQFDSKVECIKYEKRVKLYLGVVLELPDFSYYVPISSRKDKHYKMSNGADFHKIEDSEGLYAVLNLNNMIPIIPDCITQLKYNQLEKYRTFENDTERLKYINLLQKEMSIIDGIEIILKDKAKKLYAKCVQKPDSKLARRCCNFKLLEEKSLLYFR